MYSVGVRDHFMIAHSFSGETFGPAQNLHGATFVVDVELFREALDQDGVVTDIGPLSQLLKNVLAAFNYRNLDDDPNLAGQNTTTEYMARVIFECLADAIAEGDLGPNTDELTSLKVTLRESHIAWASYQNTLSRD
jgi:6-pyruvoyl-tetrahydropterin synthase